MDLDYIVGVQAIEQLEKLLSEQGHGEREELADEIIDFVNKMTTKWKRVDSYVP